MICGWLLVFTASSIMIVVFTHIYQSAIGLGDSVDGDQKHKLAVWIAFLSPARKHF